MTVDVHVFIKGHNRPLDEEDFGCPVDWEKLALFLHRNSSKRSLHHPGYELFLCLPGKYDPREGVSSYEVGEIIRSACEHALGSQVYLVLSDGISVWGAEDSYREMMVAALTAGARDILEVPYSSSTNRPRQFGGLRSGADRSSGRLNKLRDLLSNPGEWRFRTSRETGFPSQFFHREDFGKFDEVNLAVAVTSRDSPVVLKDKMSSLRLAVICESARDEERGPSGIEKWLTGWNHDGRKIVCAKCRGHFELFSLWHHLIAAQDKLKNLGRPNSARFEWGKVVRVGSPGRRRSNLVHPQRLLITNSFGASSVEDRQHILDASKEVEWMRREFLPWYEYLVHPTLKSEFLKALLERIQATMWVYMGHGNGKRGLQVFPAGLDRPETWSNCFKGYKNPMSLVFLSACRSASVAQLVTKTAGTPAIGFERDVYSEQCWSMLREIITASFHWNGDENAVRNAFHFGCESLKSVPRKDPKPVLFLP